MLAVVNYGLGNIRAIENIYKRLNIPVLIASTADELEHASRIILPGVGSFDWAMSRLGESGMRQTLDRRVLQDGVPVLGICVGMQMMARRSDEGQLPGLGWFDADIRRMPPDPSTSANARLPHMGWNDVVASSGMPLFAGMDAPRFYFLHSYYFSSSDPTIQAAGTVYFGEFFSAASKSNIHGVQFHPEKSHSWGVQLLKNFAESIL